MGKGVGHSGGRQVDEGAFDRREVVRVGGSAAVATLVPRSGWVALSCLTGIGARKSMGEDRPVKMADLVRP